MPTVSPPRSQAPSSISRHGSSSRGTFGRVSHSHSNSLSKTLSKSSRSHSQTHSRTDSWGKSALKVAKSAACMTKSDVIASEATAEAGGLESALKKDETKVIRLADPAHIPVDHGEAVDNTSTQSKSPAPSTSNDVIVGIALSTPPDDSPEPISLPGHPYAQGGLFRYKTYAPSAHSRQQGSDYAGPHPSLTAGQSLATDVSSRHRNPPQAAHPYARISRDSFFDDARIMPQPRSDSDIPPPAKMWAQWSPDVVREILPSDIQYSPYLSGDTNLLNSKTINDSDAVRRQRSRDSGVGTSEDHTAITERELAQRQILATTRRIHRKPVQYDETHPSSSTQSQKPSDPSSSHIIPSSPLGPSAPLTQPNVSTSADDPRATTASPGATSASSSSPHLFGSLDDLDSYRDLFYKSPRGKEKEHSDEYEASGSFTWEAASDRRGSGLTSLARQLSEEFHQISAERESYYSQSSTSVSQRSAFFRRPDHPGLEFVFEEVSQSESQDDALPLDVSSLAAFLPSVNIPEDVSRSSMEVDPDEDETGQHFNPGI
jgi:serine/arginine repetitive matrix protein 2